jgi:hypothetical protein
MARNLRIILYQGPTNNPTYSLMEGAKKVSPEKIEMLCYPPQGISPMLLVRGRGNLTLNGEHDVPEKANAVLVKSFVERLYSGENGETSIQYCTLREDN